MPSVLIALNLAHATYRYEVSYAPDAVPPHENPELKAALEDRPEFRSVQRHPEAEVVMNVIANRPSTLRRLYPITELLDCFEDFGYEIKRVKSA